MRLAFAATCLVLAAAATAAAPEKGSPMDAPPPPVIQGDPAPDPVVTVRQEGDRKIEEYRIRGRLYMMKVTPRHGLPYVLIDHKGDGQFARQDNLDSGLRVPQWVLLEF